MSLRTELAAWRASIRADVLTGHAEPGDADAEPVLRFFVFVMISEYLEADVAAVMEWGEEHTIDALEGRISAWIDAKALGEPWPEWPAGPKMHTVRERDALRAQIRRRADRALTAEELGPG